MCYPWHLYLMAGLYILAGIFHFANTDFYLKVMPDYLPMPRLLVYLSGAGEIMLGIAVCFPGTKNLALYGIMLMLVAFLLVHIDMLANWTVWDFSKWLLVARLLFQFVLIGWAWYYQRF